MNINIAVMIAKQRSGTHLIRNLVNSHPRAYCPPEPFFHRAPQNREALVSVLYECLIAGKENGAQAILIDIKYDQITKVIEDWIKTHKIQVLHLIRRDAKRQFYSKKLREYQERYRAEHSEEPEIIPIPFCEKEFKEHVDLVTAYIARFSELETCRMYYEKLTDNWPTAFIDKYEEMKLCDLLGVKYHQLYCTPKKDAPTIPFWEKE